MLRNWFAVVRTWLGTAVPPHHTYGTCPARHPSPRSRRRELARTLLARRTA